MPKPLLYLFQSLTLPLVKWLMRLMPSPPTQLVFAGAGSRAQLCAHIARSGTYRLLLVTDRQLLAAGLVEQVTAELDRHELQWALFAEVEPDPGFDVIEQGLTAMRREHCDAVLAIGGGSSMDAAKVIAAASEQVKAVRKLIGYFKLERPPAPLFAIPTTAGTGSEATIAAVISDREARAKRVIADTQLMPRAVALDAQLMTGMPPAITAATGMDALTHAVETYLSRWATPRSREYAGTALRLIFAYLPRAYRDGQDLEAREQMALAAYYAGLCINTASVGNVHAIAHQLGAYYHTPHGLANALVMPRVLAFCRDAAREDLAALALLLGRAEATDQDTVAAERFIRAVIELSDEVGIPARLDALRAEDIDDITRAAVREGLGYPSPRLMGMSDCRAILQQLLPDAP